ncbi:MAG: hypothetical protein ABR519_06530, partial [Bacteroidales bacterium]
MNNIFLKRETVVSVITFLSLFLLVAPEAAGQHRIKSDGSVFLQDPERTEWGLFTGDEMIEVS